MCDLLGRNSGLTAVAPSFFALRAAGGLLVAFPASDNGDGDGFGFETACASGDLPCGGNGNGICERRRPGARGESRPGGSGCDDQRKTAFALEQQGKNAEAETAWRAVLQGHPANAEAYAHLGFLEARQERYTEAVPLYRKALTLNPAMPGLRLNLGLSLFKSGAPKQAIQTFLPLLKSAPPSSPEALRLTTLIGLAHYGLGEYATAVPYLKQATAADPQNLPFRLALAHSCLWSKQYQCVLDVYKEILSLNAESAKPTCWQARLWTR